MARANGLEELLPFTVKGTEERIRKREEFGLRVKGTGVGQKVKGKGQERTMKGRLEQRKQAMLEMPQLIQSWKQVIVLLCCCWKVKLTLVIERSWSWMEKVSQMIWYFLGCHSPYYGRGYMKLFGIRIGGFVWMELHSEGNQYLIWRSNICTGGPEDTISVFISSLAIGIVFPNHLRSKTDIEFGSVLVTESVPSVRSAGVSRWMRVH